MKTKREILEEFMKKGHCENINCESCPYESNGCGNGFNPLSYRLRKIGAMAILRHNRKKRKFDPNKILTCVTAEQAKKGMRGYFADCFADMKSQFKIKHIRTLSEIRDEEAYQRFIDQAGISWDLFYPMDEVEE